MEEFNFAVLTSIVASLIVAYLTAKLTVGSRYGEVTKRLFVAVMQYYFAYRALVTEDNLVKNGHGSSFKNTKDADVYLNNLEGVYKTVCSLLDSPAATELLDKNLQVASLPISISMEIYNFKTTKVISNESCLKDMFNVMDFLLLQKPILKLKGQKIHNEVVKIHNELNDQYLVSVLGFNPNM
tara:strand:- start:45 stop:593 length:549 start_codon:yes stop_codon:yes gene_type:complete